MLRLFVLSFCAILLFFPSEYTLAKEFSQQSIDNLSEKVAKKFSRTFCNTSNFGISDEGAIEFAVGETTKQFSNNKLIKSLDFQKLNKKIISNIESDCQVFDFPITELSKLEIIKN
tara:strand:- start:1517 stop:1864 length:348 start_codon:yes stop_codon:yes gene_type:complete